MLSAWGNFGKTHTEKYGKGTDECTYLKIVGKDGMLISPRMEYRVIGEIT